jgi:alpha-tubulin suppressor-like RCC1 family protein
LSYQWLLNGNPVEGATNATPLIFSEQGTDSAACQVIVSNYLGSVTSDVARVSLRTVAVWGSGVYGVTRVPDTLTSARTITAGLFHCLAVNQDGQVIGWGKNAYAMSAAPASATNVIALACGGDHSIALRSDGTVVSWGRYLDLQTNVPPAATNVVAVAAGGAHSIALRADGSLVTWGRAANNQADIGYAGADIVQIAAGYNHNLALRSDGSVLSFGLESPAPADVTNIVEIAAGWSHALALRGDGTVVAWGNNDYGQCTVPLEATNVVAIAAGSFHNLALRADGSVLAWGRNYCGVSTVPAGLGHITWIGAGEDFSVASIGTGAPRFGSFVRSLRTHAGTPAVLRTILDGAYPMSLQWLHDGTPVPGGTNRFLVLPSSDFADAGSYTLMASNASGSQISDPINLTVLPGTGPVTAVAVWREPDARQQFFVAYGERGATAAAVGQLHGLVLYDDGRVSGWGKNADGQLDVPLSLTNAVAIAAGGNHSLALRDDGTVIAWGRNWDGQTTVPDYATNVIAVAAGLAHSLALKADGTLVAWGNNDYGQTNVSFVANNVRAISCGHYHSIALRRDGIPATWGWDVPLPVGASNLVAVAAGWEHCLALRSDGAVLAWGDNTFGQSTVPASATNVIAIAAGYYHNLALRSDGTILAWGIEKTEIPVVNPQLPSLAQLAAGESYSAVLVGREPRFGRQQKSIAAQLGQQCALRANLAGACPISMTWFHDGVAIAQGTNSDLVLASSQLSDAGSYFLVASNQFGCATSAPVSLTVSFPSTITSVGGWGSDALGQSSAPNGPVGPRHFSAGPFHGLAANADGSVTAWAKTATGRLPSQPSRPMRYKWPREATTVWP